MSRPTDDRPDDARATTDDASTADDDWHDRHARVEPDRVETPVRADPPREDWHARHGRTKRVD